MPDSFQAQHSIAIDKYDSFLIRLANGIVFSSAFLRKKEWLVCFLSSRTPLFSALTLLSCNITTLFMRRSPSDSSIASISSHLQFETSVYHYCWQKTINSIAVNEWIRSSSGVADDTSPSPGSFLWNSFVLRRININPGIHFRHTSSHPNRAQSLLLQIKPTWIILPPTLGMGRTSWWCGMNKSPILLILVTPAAAARRPTSTLQITLAQLVFKVAMHLARLVSR